MLPYPNKGLGLRETFRYNDTYHLNKQYFTVLMKTVFQLPIKVTEVTWVILVFFFCCLINIISLI